MSLLEVTDLKRLGIDVPRERLRDEVLEHLVRELRLTDRTRLLSDGA